MTHFFQKRDRWGNGMALWVLTVMVFLTPIAVWGVKSLQMENEVHQWVSSDNLQAKAFRWYKQQFPADEAFLFTWDGSSLDDPRVEAFAKKIRPVTGEDGVPRGGLKQVKSVRTPQELIGEIARHGVTREEAVARLKGVLIGAGKLRVRLTETGRGQREKCIQLLTRQVDEKLGLKLEVFPAGPVPSLAALDENCDEMIAESGSAEGSVAQSASSGSGSESVMPSNTAHDFQVRWVGMQPTGALVDSVRKIASELQLPVTTTTAAPKPLVEECFFVPGAPIAIAISLSESGQADRKLAFRNLRAAAIEAGIPADAIHMGGGSVSGAALNEEVQRSVWNTEVPVYQLHRRTIVGISGLVGAILSFWLLRSVRLSALVLGASYFTVLLSVSLVPMTGGSMNMVLVVMPTLLFVTTLSGSIHLANYWRHAAFKNAANAVVDAVRTARTPCIWASLTTAIGLASLMTSSLQPIRAFGMYSAIGTIVSLFIVLYGLPALLQICPIRKPRQDELDQAGWQSFGQWIVCNHKAVTVASALIAGVSMYGFVYFKTETKVIRYFSENTQIVKDYNFLEENLAGIVPVEVIVRFDQESQSELKFLERAELVGQIQRKLRGLEDISGALSLVDFLPEVEPPPENSNVRQRALYAAKSRAIEERVKSGQSGAGAFLSTAGTASEFNAPGDELWRVTAQVAIMSELHYGSFTQRLDEICQSVLRTTSGQSEENYRPAATQVAYHPGASHLVTGMVPLFLATQEELLNSLLNSFILAFSTIAVVMMIMLRHPVAGLLAMVPNILPIGIVFGLVSWGGLAVDIGTVVTASVALGIAIDGTLHIITWFRMGIAAGKLRSQAVIDALNHCGPAMWQTSFVVGLGLLMLWPADLVLISRFGWLMAALIGAALVADLFLAPALLAGPMGAILERCTKREAAVAATEKPAVEAAEPVPSRLPETASPHAPRESVGTRIRRIDG